MSVDHTAVVMFGVPVALEPREANTIENLFDARFPDIEFRDFGDVTAFGDPTKIRVVLGAGRQSAANFERVNAVDEKKIAGQIKRALEHFNLTAAGELGWYFGVRTW